MRPVLYKALTKKKSEWVVGSIFYKYTRKNLFSKFMVMKWYIRDNNGKCHRIIRETVCSLIRCIDIHGRLIWEHDIVKYDDILWEVCWDSDNYQYIIRNEYESIKIQPGLKQYFERVGNMFDNPELINLNQN